MTLRALDLRPLAESKGSPSSTCRALQPSSFPLLPLLWKAPSGAGQLLDAPSKEGEAARLALSVVDRFGLNDDQVRLLESCPFPTSFSSRLLRKVECKSGVTEHDE